MTTTASDPAIRAQAAAEALAAEGQPVTARAVRERAGVMTTVATKAARNWRDQHDQATSIPDVPPALTARLEAIWADAYTTARAQFDTEREGWAARLERANTEITELTAEAERGDEQYAELNDKLQEVQGHLTDALDALEAERAISQEIKTQAAVVSAHADAIEKSYADLLAALKTTPPKPTKPTKPTP